MSAIYMVEIQCDKRLYVVTREDSCQAGSHIQAKIDARL